MDQKKPEKAYKYFIDTIKLYSIVADPPDIHNILKLPYPLYVDTIQAFAEQKKKEYQQLQQKEKQIRTRTASGYK